MTGAHFADVDDNLPQAFIYVVLRARVRQLHATVEYISQYRRQSDLEGKGGYCLVNLSISMEYIEALDASQLVGLPHG